MLTLKRISIHRYKCIESEQTFDVDKGITVLVGMNESGKTSILEALAKSNYFEDDPLFKFNPTHDYPRKEKKKIEKKGEFPYAITCVYEISDELLKKIEKDLGSEVFVQKEIAASTGYDNKRAWQDLRANHNRFVDNKLQSSGLTSKTIKEKLYTIKEQNALDELIQEYKTIDTKNKLTELKKYFENKWNWSNDPLGEYIARTYLQPALPKYLYYDEYYALPSRISIEKMQKKQLESESLKTAKALFDLADIDVNELIEAKDFEDYKAELEATEATITEELFEYWSTNKNLEIEFDIDKIEQNDPRGNNRIVEHVLDIRVRNNRSKVSLPLRNRSKGFNWFFSFLVWFKKIQEDTDSHYILLLDEPGLNLHASAQSDLLDFVEHLSKSYQILYTTHSPFMVDPSHLERVRTVVETEFGSVISDSVQEKDPNTLFPLQAALGYDLAQNLFISKNNLLIEGVSDLIYFQAMSGILQELKRTSLREDITLVPVGGLDKVSTFVSLLRGNKLNIACMLDSSIDMSSKTKIDNLVREKIIQKQRILFYKDFLTGFDEADVEDLFEKENYLRLFNAAFSELPDIAMDNLDTGTKRIIVQLNNYLNVSRFNHYRPANQLVRLGVAAEFFSETTITNFENMFTKVNSLF